jgi:hypothetical protein
MHSKKKSQLGQFYTTNYKYILQNMFLPDFVDTIIEPFCGNGDLLEFIDKDIKDKYKLECYDIDVKKPYINERDTLLNPPDYNNKFILTNPPYLARNKSKDKTIFDKYDSNDLYKCFLTELLTNTAIGGIIIIPLNFLSSIRKNDVDLRKKFLEVYNIVNINIFEEKVFSDTSYAVCSLQFLHKDKSDGTLLFGSNGISLYIFPRGEQIFIELNKSNNYTIGGHIYKLPQNKKILISRLTKDNNSKYTTNILLKCIDDSNKKKICLSIVKDDEIYSDDTENSSARSYASLIIEPKLNIKQQKILVDLFNKYLNEERDKYNSLFLTNYRESKGIARKRISFKLAFEIINYLINKFKILS